MCFEAAELFIARLVHFLMLDIHPNKHGQVALNAELVVFREKNLLA